jgi:hypothetical protein
LRHAEFVIEQLESQEETLSALPRAEKVAVYSRHSAMFGRRSNGALHRTAKTRLLQDLPRLQGGYLRSWRY